MSYRCKHNEANGEDNDDGTDANYSQDYGAEGETSDLRIEALRKRQIENFLLTLFISRGVPMLLGGDEFRRTQGGNNNAYCQDNETSWYDWSCLDKHGGILAFTRGMIAFRRAHPILSKEQFYTDTEIQWFGPYGRSPNWSDPNAKQLACLIHEDQGNSLYLMFNAWTESVDFGLPALLPGTRWRLAVDTSGESQQDLFAPGTEPLWEDPRTYHLRPRSSAILLAR